MKIDNRNFTIHAYKENAGWVVTINGITWKRKTSNIGNAIKECLDLYIYSIL